ncbi:MAG: UDP-2,4-diacetamido-2,4,6-trideoxy-beta-L-altropyranose hydrolase [Betaproteobacteria bacterium]|nr:UDP-2,4-diacetamido-2,4,6-trideoxy-beta-L-altropyranose hydrolase [Betaproteobacteria bacterium]MDH5350165.1 UDP-2,4-diacetamido-2,4,6-trideoxy-beta-L-altropyranose hydrolase [Betaproteobacteria bacterium]
MRILVRTDASVATGTGHLRRCLTLAAALRDGGATVSFACAAPAPEVRQMVLDRSFPLATVAQLPIDNDGVTAELAPGAQEVDASATLAIAEPQGFDWVVVDHYGLAAPWERRMRAGGRRIMAIDDLADRPHDCDLLLDQNLRAEGETAYASLVPPGCDRLLGPHYALIDPAFASARAALRPSLRDGILISFGGSDPRSLTVRVLRALLATAPVDLRIDVVAGALQRSAAELAEIAGGASNVRFHHATREMPRLMAGASLFLGAGGTTSWERCCMALPGVVVSVAPNQEPLCRALAEAGGHVYLGSATDVEPDAMAKAALQLLGSPDRLAQLAERSAALVDGHGARRVAARILSGEVRLRAATPEDADRILEWRNHPEVRRHAGNSQAIEQATHARWFASVLADPDRHLLVAEDSQGACGVLRFDVSSRTAKISIYAVPERIGRGIGAALLSAGERWLAARRPEVTTLCAEVHAANVASIRIFAAAGYRARESTYVKIIPGREAA